MKEIQRIILAFMLGIVPIQLVWADSKATELNLEDVKSFIEQGGMNAKGKDSATILIYASGSGHLGVVKTLVEGKSSLLSMFNKRADINAKATIDNNGKKAEGVTALIIASMQGHLEVVKYLISKGANVNDKFKISGKMNIDGGTALIIALMGGHLEIAKYLISKGADVNVVMSISAYNFITLDYNRFRYGN